MGSINDGVGKKGGSAFNTFVDIAAYTNKTFGMYGGKEKRQWCPWSFADRLIGVVI